MPELLPLGRSDCLALRGLGLAVFLDVRVVHIDMILDHSEMASLHSGQLHVPAALVRLFRG